MNHRTFKISKKWTICILTALIVQFVFLMVMSRMQFQDFPSDYLITYRPIAENLLESGDYFKEEDIAFNYPPGYPLFVTVILSLHQWTGIGELRILQFVNVLIMTLNFVIVVLLFRQYFSPSVALTGGMLWLTYPFHLWLIRNPSSEIPFMLFLFVSLLMFVRGMKEQSVTAMLISGVFVGVAGLFRPIVILYAIVLTAIIFMQRGIDLRKKVIWSLAVCGAFLLTILPWEIIAWHQTHDIIPLSVAGPGALIDGFGYAFRADPSRVPEDVYRFMVTLKDHRYELHDSFSKVLSFLLDYFRSSPLTMLKLAALKLVRPWYGTDSMWYETPIVIIQMLYLIPFAAGFYMNRKNERLKIFNRLAVLSILYFWIMTFLVLSILRYMIPVMVFLFAYIASFGHDIFQRMTGPKAKGSHG